MTSLDIRNNSAVNKRAEQLKRWEESDTNQQPPVPRPERGSRIKFSSGCIFLAACLAGDKDEVLKLLEQGADINTANVDGLTALHQACIDDNLEMVEFLVEQGADINRQDNEGWTPLHATASCGFVSIARYLVEHGADVAAVNSDGDLAVDLAVDIQHLPMIDFMQKMVAEQQIDCAKARQAEQQQMLTDAKKWLRSDASEVDRPHPKTGATALHVAAAKGYTKVLSLLLAGRANVDAQDNDGWTPLHAAAHWGQKEAAEMLLDAMADMDVRNYAGQTCIDVAERKMVKYLEEYRANNKRIKRRPSSQISRISDTIENHMDKTPPKIIRVKVRPENNKDHANVSTCVASTSGYSGSSGGSSLPTNSESEETDSDLTDSTESSHSTSLSEPDEEDDKSSVQKTANDAPATEDEAPWRRNNVSRVRSANDSPSKNQVPDVIDVKKTTPTNATATETTDVILRRTQSFENDEKSFVPPVRDEESETQRKAHAKRVRETRRSTQGVTLDEIKSAEELVKKKNSTMNNNNNNNNSSNNETQANVVEPSEAATAISIPTAATATTTTTNNEQNSKEAEISTDPTKSEEDTNTKASNDGGGADNDDDDDNVTSFTIIAPSAANRSRPSSLIVTAKTTTISSKSAAMAAEEVEDAQEEVSATFVMPPRKDSRTPTPTSKTETATENVETTIVITSPKRTANKAITDDEKDRQREEKVNQETEKGEHKEDEQEDDEEDAGIKPDKKTEPPPLEGMVVTTSAAEAPRVPSPTTQRAHTNERMRAAFFSPLPLAEPIAASNQNKPPSATTTPTLESPVRLRDKRSLFDMDNASSQTLADKLRQETHRYGYDEKRGGIFAGESSISAATLNQPSHVAHSVHESSTDRDSSMSPLFCNLGPIPGLGFASRRSLDSSSASLPNSPLHTRDREAGGNDQAGHHNNGANANAADRRPSWRLKFDAGSKFKLEDVNAGNTYHPPTNSTIIPSAPAVIAAANSMSQRRITSVNNAMSSSNQSLNSIGRPVSAPPTSNLSNSSNTSSSITSSSISQKNDEKSHENSSNTNPTATSSTSTSSSGIGSSSASSYAARRASANTSATAALNAETPSGAASATSTTSSSLSNNDDKDNDKENDNRSALATQAVIQRRRKPKRRSTGVVHIDMDELDPEKQDSANDTEDKEKESGGESRGSRSRAGSTVSVSTSTTSATDDKKTRDKTENSGDNIDYKALWEAVKLENDKLKQQLKKKDEEVVQTRATLERFANATNKNSLSEIEKRERRAMERKLSELEEELKLLQKLKNENERLRAENRALTRVVSKLTSSAQSQLSKANNKQ
ncbi:protein phosphatase 1 regulatory subunit 12A isoform X8 [Stomoxys calcitrans]|uniref:protein phosphatase 1 regulatory subunit 12A isoform X8 n=1 Tax=Stomoxys calcitrans TaxID=35570 RepID=UPI0027E3614C|nr:protein phosphatase 1 regulatory subunit 12A isoform X8 [Stomoxys calcitrans]